MWNARAKRKGSNKHEHLLRTQGITIVRWWPWISSLISSSWAMSSPNTLEDNSHRPRYRWILDEDRDTDSIGTEIVAYEHSQWRTMCESRDRRRPAVVVCRVLHFSSAVLSLVYRSDRAYESELVHRSSRSPVSAWKRAEVVSWPTFSSSEQLRDRWRWGRQWAAREEETTSET